MTSWFAGSSAGKFFGLGAGGVLSSYVTYTRSETHRQRPPESRAARKARGREAVQATPAMFGKAIAVSPGPSIMEAIANAAPPVPSADGTATETEEMTVTRRSVEVLATEDETSTSSSTGGSTIRRKHEGRYGHGRCITDDRAGGGKFANFGHTAVSIAAPFILSALKDLLSRRWRRLRRKDADARRMERLRELLLALENSGHELAVPIAEELERLVTERDDARKELEERKRRRRRSPFGPDVTAQPPQPASPIDLAIDVSLRTKAAVARVKDLLTPGKKREGKHVAFTPGATPAKGTANLDSANASPENDQASNGGSPMASAMADLDRTVGFQAKELRYLRMTLKDKESRIGHLTKRLKAAVDSAGSLEADSAGSSPMSATHHGGLNWDVVAPKIVESKIAAAFLDTPGADSDDELTRQMWRMKRRPNFALVTPAVKKHSDEERLKRAKSRVGRISPTGKRVAWVAVDSP